MLQMLETFWQFIDYPRGVEYNRVSQKPLQGAKMTVMDILELRDFNGQLLRAKYGLIRPNWFPRPILPPSSVPAFTEIMEEV